MSFEKKSTSEVIAYIAGFLDGEGSFGFRKAQSTRPTPFVCITQKNKDILLMIQEFFIKTFNIKLGLCETKNGCWHLQTFKKMNAFAICLIMYPYLIVKKNQAAGIIEFIKLRLDEGVQGKINVDREDEIVDTISLLNGGRF